MMSGTSRDFRDNGMDMGITPILPPDVNSPTQLVSQNMSAFSRAVNNDVKPAAAPILPANDGQQLANDAIGVGQNLGANAKQTSGMQVKGSDAAYLGNQVGQAMSQVAGGALGILGAEAKDAQEIREKAQLEDDQKPTPAAAPAQFTMPSVSGGMSAGPGGR
jgi:hypothetical protein